MATEQLPVRHGWNGAAKSMEPEEWEALAIQFRAACRIVPYFIWKNLTAESRAWIGSLVQTRAQFIVTNPAIEPRHLTTSASAVTAKTRDTAYIRRLVDILRRCVTVKELP